MPSFLILKLLQKNKFALLLLRQLFLNSSDRLCIIGACPLDILPMRCTLSLQLLPQRCESLVMFSGAPLGLGQGSNCLLVRGCLLRGPRFEVGHQRGHGLFVRVGLCLSLRIKLILEGDKCSCVLGTLLLGLAMQLLTQVCDGLVVRGSLRFGLRSQGRNGLFVLGGFVEGLGLFLCCG